MKTKIFLSILTVFIVFATAEASFPVKRVLKTNETETTTQLEDNTSLMSPAAAMAGQDKWVGVAFWAFLGWPFAAHRWYYKKPVGWNILFILTIGGLGIWAIVDLVNILTDKF